MPGFDTTNPPAALLISATALMNQKLSCPWPTRKQFASDLLQPGSSRQCQHQQRFPLPTPSSWGEGIFSQPLCAVFFRTLSECEDDFSIRDFLLEEGNLVGAGRQGQGNLAAFSY